MGDHMSQKFLITKELLNGAEYRIAALFEDRRMLEAAVQLSDESERRLCRDCGRNALLSVV